MGLNSNRYLCKNVWLIGVHISFCYMTLFTEKQQCHMIKFVKIQATPTILSSFTFSNLKRVKLLTKPDKFL